ncbi:hypothetical protein [Spongiactinospora sp. TRM90649]|uniref:hypothetical protein n=1 Tax=Spongiactinospora sp. TRM90649 TaxID=3031114 RepID=UPI0023FA2CD7|nr:hypothetical protein [Spongiactinospora sp. TRM90649]MDF5756220.1 hypothetical protein [Spongiactinospora sp. TRM90649]
MRVISVLLGLAGLGAMVAVFLLLRGPERADRVEAVAPVAPAPSPPAGPNVLVDVRGTVIEEFTGDCAGSRHPYVCRYAVERLRAVDPLLPSRAGLTIATTIDLRLQRAAQQGIDAHVHTDDAPVAALAMVEPGQGAIRALATSRGAGEGRGFPHGTTAMPYTLAAALAAGLRYDDGFLVTDEYRAAGYGAIRNCAGQGVADPSLTVLNAMKGGQRFVTLRTGTRDTVNTFYMRLLERVGLCESVTMAQRLGLRRTDGTPLKVFLTFPFGTNETDPVSVAASYAAFAARGRYCEPMIVTEIRAGSRVLRSFPADCRQVLVPEVADAVTGVLSDGPRRSPLRGFGRDAAGMHSTGDFYGAAWYAGYTPKLAAAVSLGDPRGIFQHDLADVTIGGRHYDLVDGLGPPASVWKDAMAEAVRGTPRSRFTPPDAQRFGGCHLACPR